LNKIMARKTIENLTKSSLSKVFRRLKKDTKGFSTLLVRDPIDFVDFESNLDEALDSLLSEINKNHYHPQKPCLHPSPKSKGINRPTVVFDVKDALVYRFCIEQIEDVLFKKARQKNIRGGVKITPNRAVSGGDFYEKWFKDWADHLDGIKDSLTTKRYLVNTDIASYFENINILVLKDLVRSDVKEKKGVMNLLFYFLENTRFRIDYEVNTFTGLLQEDIDCSRVLAYYFLHLHDGVMRAFCKEHDAEFYRFVDDMSIAVNSEVIGKKALRCITESLRRLNLVSSIEKTTIFNQKIAKQQLFFAENTKLSEFEKNVLLKLGKGQKVTREVQAIQKYYQKLLRDEKDEYKNWIKILKRFYSLAAYTKSNFLFSDITKHLIDYPILFTGSNTKLSKYLLRTRGEKKFNSVMSGIIKYLYSKENLYSATETSLLELLLTIDPQNYSPSVKIKIKTLADDILFKKNGYNPLSDYARALACLFFYRYRRSDIDRIANHYLRSNEENRLIRKYLISVSLITQNNDLRTKVLNKAKKEQDLSINRLINLVDNINEYKKLPTIKHYLKEKEVYYTYKNPSVQIIEKYRAVRAEILNEIISIYST